MYHYVLQTARDRRHKEVNALGSFEAYIRERYGKPVRVQSDLLDDADVTCLVNFVGKFESLDCDFKLVTRRLGLDVELAHSNASKRSRDFRAYFDEETFEMVRSAHAKDVVRFGYDNFL